MRSLKTLWHNKVKYLFQILDIILASNDFIKP